MDEPLQLTPTESRVAACLAEGIEANLLPNPPAEVNLSQGSIWDECQTVRAEFLRRILTEADWDVKGTSVRLRGARISGQLDLTSAVIGKILVLQDCCLELEPVFNYADGQELVFKHCRMPGLFASRLKLRGALYFGDGFEAHGHVMLDGAEIGGTFACHEATFKNPGRTALSCVSANLKGGLVLNAGFYAEGEVNLMFSQIGGILGCQGANLKNPNGTALSCYQVKVEGALSLIGGFRAEGQVNLVGANIGGSLACNRGTFINPSRTALLCEDVNVRGSVYLAEKFEALGEVCLMDADIGGALICSGGIFHNEKGTALSCDQATIRSGVYLSAGFQAVGNVSLVGAEIGGSLAAAGGSFSSSDGPSISLSGATIRGDLFLANDFRAEGPVYLAGAKVGGDFLCQGATFMSPDKDAIVCARAVIGGSVGMNRDFLAEGGVNLLGAHVGGDLDCTGGTFRNPSGEAFGGERMNVSGRFIWRPSQIPVGRVNFASACVGHYLDSKDSWSPDGDFALDGFIYSSIVDVPTARDRIVWLGRNHRYSPQPYEYLAHTYRNEGNDSAARAISIAKQVKRRRSGGLAFPQKIGSWIFGVTVRYGYQPSLALLWLAAFWLAGGLLLTFGPGNQGVMARVGTQMGPSFRPWLYAADILVPFVNFRQGDFWLPDLSRPWGLFYTLYFVVSIAVGWVLAAALAATVSGISRRN